MRRSTVFLAASGSLLLAACGAVAPAQPGGVDGGSSTTTPADAAAGSDATTGTLVVEGSYDVTFTFATVNLLPGGPPAPPAPAPSLATPARLDLRRAGSAWEALFTPRWGTPASLAVSETAAALVLKGEARVHGAAGGGVGGATDTWKTLTLARDATGKLTGDVKASGDESIFQGDVVWSGTLVGGATLAADATAPELRSRVVSPIGPGDRMLPWDPIRVQAAEPVTPAPVRDVTVIAGPTTTVPLVFEKAARPDSWAGEVAYTGRVSSWASVMNGQPWVVANTSSSIKDLVGLAAAPLSTPLKFLQLGFAAPEIGFDSDVVFASLWGESRFLGGGFTGATDPRCEAGGCVKIGPASFGVCDATRAGFAGILASDATKTKVGLRYRVLAEPENPGDLFVHSDLVTLELARQVGQPVDTIVRPSDVKMPKLATSIDGMSFGTTWLDLDVAAPAGTGPVGVAVAIGGPSALVGVCGGPPIARVKLEVLVERVGWK